MGFDHRFSLKCAVKSWPTTCYLVPRKEHMEYHSPRLIRERETIEKMTRLYDQGAVSQQTYNNTKTGYDVAKANYESARHQVWRVCCELQHSEHRGSRRPEVMKLSPGLSGTTAVHP